MSFLEQRGLAAKIGGFGGGGYRFVTKARRPLSGMAAMACSGLSAADGVLMTYIKLIDDPAASPRVT
jgi:hypothetical protein